MITHDAMESSLQQLASLRDRLRELLEWEKLARSERRPHLPPAFDPAAAALSSARDDLAVAYGAFVQSANQIQRTLQRHDLDCPDAQRHIWRQRLKAIQGEVAALGLGATFIKG